MTAFQARLVAFFAALSTLLGLQTLRAFLPQVVYVYGARPDVSSIDMGRLAIGIFLTAFLAFIPQRVLGTTRALLVTAAVLALTRLFAPLVAPGLSFVLITLGTVAFLWHVPLLLAATRGGGPEAGAHVGLGIVLGLALDVAVSGAFATWDLVWRRTPPAMAVSLAIVVVYARLLRDISGAAVDAAQTDGPPQATIGLAGLGPLLFLNLLLFQNTARVSAVTGWPLQGSLLWVLAADAIAVAVAATVRQHRLALLAALALILAASRAHGTDGEAAVAIAIGSVVSAILILAIAAAQAETPRGAGLRRTSIGWGVGMLLFAVPAFLYYVGYDIRLPFENTLLAPVAATIAALAAVTSLRAWPRVPELRPTLSRPVRVLLVVPLLLWAVSRPPQSPRVTGWPIRVMSYNLHQGFATSGALDLEALARTIEDAEADVVALQEVSRGWVINGSTDMLAWLSRRLRMSVAWGPAADAVWGNAVLSRRTIVVYDQIELPRGGVAMRRGALAAEIELGGRDRLVMIATHLHHVEGHSQVRVPQATALVEWWKKRESTVVLGDFNAAPDAPEMEVLRAAGLRDAFLLAGSGPGLTFSSDNPQRRIDYIWLSPDLLARDFRVMPGQASDHLGIAVTIEKERR
jgi:endonuclease/exonuclease/phosphatase family metal-dependent hydrolase